MADAGVIEFPCKLDEQNCITCGVKFAMPVELIKRRERDHRPFHCPNGHQQMYTAESVDDIIKKQQVTIDNLRHALDRIVRIDVGLFNKASLELAIEIATNALKEK